MLPCSSNKCMSGHFKKYNTPHVLFDFPEVSILYTLGGGPSLLIQIYAPPQILQISDPNNNNLERFVRFAPCAKAMSTTEKYEFKKKKFTVETALVVYNIICVLYTIYVQCCSAYTAICIQRATDKQVYNMYFFPNAICVHYGNCNIQTTMRRVGTMYCGNIGGTYINT